MKTGNKIFFALCEYSHTIRYVWKDPEILLAGRNSIDVYIDRSDPEKYFMDISFLGSGAK